MGNTPKKNQPSEKYLELEARLEEAKRFAHYPESYMTHNEHSMESFTKRSIALIGLLNTLQDTITRGVKADPRDLHDVCDHMSRLKSQIRILFGYSLEQELQELDEQDTQEIIDKSVNNMINDECLSTYLHDELQNGDTTLTRLRISMGRSDTVYNEMAVTVPTIILEEDDLKERLIEELQDYDLINCMDFRSAPDTEVHDCYDMEIEFD